MAERRREAGSGTLSCVTDHPSHAAGYKLPESGPLAHFVQARDVVRQQVADDQAHGKALPARAPRLIPPPQLGQHLRDAAALDG